MPANRPSRAELIEENEALLDKLEEMRDQLDEVLEPYTEDDPNDQD